MTSGEYRCWLVDSLAQAEGPHRAALAAALREHDLCAAWHALDLPPEMVGPGPIVPDGVLGVVAYLRAEAEALRTSRDAWADAASALPGWLGWIVSNAYDAALRGEPPASEQIAVQIATRWQRDSRLRAMVEAAAGAEAEALRAEHAATIAAYDEAIARREREIMQANADAMEVAERLLRLEEVARAYLTAEEAVGARHSAEQIAAVRALPWAERALRAALASAPVDPLVWDAAINAAQAYIRHELAKRACPEGVHPADFYADALGELRKGAP